MDKNNLQRPQRAGARFYLTIKLKDYLSQSRRRGSEVVHGAASLFTISRTRVKGREQRREASCSAVLCWRDKAVSYGGRTFTRVWDRLWINPLHGQAGWEGMSLIILRFDCVLVMLQKVLCWSFVSASVQDPQPSVWRPEIWSWRRLRREWRPFSQGEQWNWDICAWLTLLDW